MACNAELGACAGTDMAACFLPKVYGKGPCTSTSYKAYQNAVKPGSLVAKLGTPLPFIRNLDKAADRLSGHGTFPPFNLAELFAAAVDTAVDHLNKACGGRWPGILPGYRRGLPTPI